MMMPLAVRTVQQGLTQMSREIVEVPEPGPIDGVWGPRTRTSLARFISTSSTSTEDARMQILAIDATPARATMVMLDDLTARSMVDAAGDFIRTSRPGQLAPSDLTPNGAVQPPITIGPSLDEPYASPGAGSGFSTVAKVGLGVLVVGAVGGVVWMISKRR